MSNIGSSRTEQRNLEEMHRQSSRSASHVDTLDLDVNTNDILDHDMIHQEQKSSRRTESSRRDPAPKRSYESSSHRPNRPSPPSVTHKHYSSPSTASSSRPHHRHHSSQRSHRISSSSPSPPPPPASSSSTSSSSRHPRSTRPSTAVKRPHSRSRSPYERPAPPTHRSRPPSSKDLPDINPSVEKSSSSERTSAKKSSSHIESGDLSVISEDESTKTTDHRPTRPKVNPSNETSSTPINNKAHSTPSTADLRPNPNETSFEMSNIVQEGDLSLFANSLLSNTQMNGTPPPAAPPSISLLTASTSMSTSNELLQAMDLISGYKAMQSNPSRNVIVEALEKQILDIIRKKVELQQRENEIYERTLKLRELELVEREKRFQIASVDSAPVTDPINIEENSQSDPTRPNETEKTSEEEAKDNASATTPMETTNPSGTSSDISEESNQITRKNGTKSRFSKATVDPVTFALPSDPPMTHFSDDQDEESENSSKRVAMSHHLGSSDTHLTMGDTELKVTSTNSSRKVEIQSGATEKKNSSDDLRYRISKNRSKQVDNGDYQQQQQSENNNANRIISDDEQKITINQIIPSKSQTTKDETLSNYEYHSQRSVTASTNEISIDQLSHDRRDNRRQYSQHPKNPRRQPSYSGQSSSSLPNNSNERSYPHASQSSHYGSNRKRYENEDLRSRLHESKNSRPRTNHRNNH